MFQLWEIYQLRGHSGLSTSFTGGCFLYATNIISIIWVLVVCDLNRWCKCLLFIEVSIPGYHDWTLQLIAFDNAEKFPRSLTDPTFTELIILDYNAQYLGHV